MDNAMRSSFLKSETGAITVDWVVISAGLVGLGIAVTSLVSGSVETKSGEITNTVNAAEIVTDFDMRSYLSGLANPVYTF